MKFLIIVTILAVAVLWLKSRSNSGDRPKADKAVLHDRLKKKKSQSAALAHNPYHAVSIHSKGKVCPSVAKLAKQRFLVAEAPITPLPDCSSPHCVCTYRHHKDRRRDTIDRRNLGQPSNVYFLQSGNKGSRRARGRREEDRESPLLA
jgi:hypothetical protein